MLLTAFGLSRFRTGPLPHNEIYNDLPAAEAVARLRRSPEEDVVFAYSRDFWEEREQERWGAIYPAYENYYERKLAECKAVLGPPSFEGHWTDDAYPVYAVGERIAVWGAGEDTIYLQIYQMDTEIGIEVALLTPRSPNANHEAKSVHEGNRKWLRKQQRGEEGGEDQEEG